jgi:ATP-dependent Lon protease
VSTWQTGGPHLKASVLHAPEIVETGIELEVLQRQLRDTVFEVLAMTPNSSKEAAETISRINDPLQLAYVTTFNMNLTTEVRQELLEIDSVSQKIRVLLSHLSQRERDAQHRKKDPVRSSRENEQNTKGLFFEAAA